MFTQHPKVSLTSFTAFRHVELQVASELQLFAKDASIALFEALPRGSVVTISTHSWSLAFLPHISVVSSAVMRHLLFCNRASMNG